MMLFRTILTMLFSVVLVNQAEAVTSTVMRARLSTTLQEQLRQLESECRLVIYVDVHALPKQGPQTYQISVKQARLIDLETLLPIFIEEWRLLPTMLVHRTQLKYIAFGTEMRLRVESSKRYAIPDYYTSGMFYDVKLPRRDNYMEHYFRGAVHHEFFHYIDYRDDFLVYHDRNWANLNTPMFRYGNGGINNRESTQVLVNQPSPGFLTKYSMSGVEEDKAEIFRCMMLNLVETEERAKTDGLLLSKLTQMKTLLNKFCPEMAEPYWESLKQFNRPRLTVKGMEDQWAREHPHLAKPTEASIASEPACSTERTRNLHRLIRRRLVCH